MYGDRKSNLTAIAFTLVATALFVYMMMEFTK